MVALGLLILGFVAYELWGTSLHTSQAQSSLEDQYFERLAALEAAAEPVAAGPTTEPPDAPEPEAVDPFLDPAVLARLAELPPPEGGDPIGRIEIPAIGIDWWMVEGTDLSYLRDGPGHFVETAMPGQPGNAALAGHRTTYGAPFHNIDRLQIGDEITVSTVQGKFVYEVMPIPIVDGEAQWRPPPRVLELGPDGDATALVDGESAQGPTPTVAPPVEPEGYAPHFIVGPNDGEILADYGDDRLTLMACHPKYSARERIVVSARLVGPAAPPTPRATPPAPATDRPLTDTGEGGGADLLEGGDPSARTPMVLWGLLAALVVVVAHQVGKRWRRWPAYVVACPLFLAALWSFYANLDALLPAAL